MTQEKTPEKEWDKVKSLVFKNGCDSKLDKIVMDGFKDSESENEKWVKLFEVVKQIKLKYKL